MKRSKKIKLLKKLRDVISSWYATDPAEPDKYEETLKELDAELAALKKERREIEDRILRKFRKLLEQRKCE